MGFIGRALSRHISKALDDVAQRPEVRRVVDRSHQQIALAKVAREVAGHAFDDEEACRELRERLPGDSEITAGAVHHLAELRTGYLDDRAYRLLTAAIDRTPVRPMDPAVRDLFEDEERLGRMTLQDAFAYLALLEPRLRDMETAGRARLPRPKQRGWSVSFRSADAPVVGPLADRPHAILNTDLAADVVREYLHAVASGRAPVDTSTPFFQLKRRTSGGTFRIFGHDPRPRASN